MKLLLAAMGLFAAVSLFSQTTTPTPAQRDIDVQVNRRIAERAPSQTLYLTSPARPNEIRRNGVSYQGIFVQAAKTSDPLELINPAASAEYGSSEDNTVFDPISGNATGLKVFSIQF